jgi:hypothetical protein
MVFKDREEQVEARLSCLSGHSACAFASASRSPMPKTVLPSHFLDCTIDTTGTDQPDVGFRISTEMLTQ